MADNDHTGASGRHAELGESLLKSISRFPQPKLKNPFGVSKLKGLWGDALSVRALVGVAALAALFGTTVVYILNAESRLLREGQNSTLLALGFILVLLAYRFCQRYLIAQSSRSIENALHVWRQRIMSKVSRLTLRNVEDMDRQHLTHAMTRHYEPLSQAIITIASGVECFVLLLFMYIYLVMLSPMAALLTGVVAFVTVLGYLAVSEQLSTNMRKAGESDSLFGRLSRSASEGVKELRINAKKRDEFLKDADSVSEELLEHRAQGASLYAEVMASGTTASYLMAGAVVFVLPLLNGAESDDVSRIVMAVLFIIGPIGGVIASLQQWNIARFAVEELTSLEGRLDDALRSQSTADQGANAPSADSELRSFERLVFSGVGYTHRAHSDDDSGFAVTDVSLTLMRGQAVFITGANGSGKTTIMRVLVGLYPREAGTVYLDDEPVARHPDQSYRSLFSTVFTDYHLFEKPYALDEQQFQLLDYWLERLGISDKITIKPGLHIDANALSTGQRKRLALALALAEDRPILVLDEWAADQDPQTRRFFYEELIPDLQSQGKSFLIVTHDEKYFDCASAHYHVSEGVLLEVKGDERSAYL